MELTALQAQPELRALMEPMVRQEQQEITALQAQTATMEQTALLVPQEPLALMAAMEPPEQPGQQELQVIMERMAQPVPLA